MPDCTASQSASRTGDGLAHPSDHSEHAVFGEVDRNVPRNVGTPGLAGHDPGLEDLHTFEVTRDLRAGTARDTAGSGLRIDLRTDSSASPCISPGKPCVITT